MTDLEIPVSFSTESDKPRDHCAVFGIYGHQQAAQLTYLGLLALQHRGQEGSGIVTCEHEALTGKHHFHIYLDASVVECLVDHSVALTSRIYTAPQGPISANTNDLQSFFSLNIWEVKPISIDRLTS